MTHAGSAAHAAQDRAEQGEIQTQRSGVREFFGRGSLLGFQLIPESVYQAGYMNNGMMTMSATALILVGCVIWVHRAYFYKENN